MSKGQNMEQLMEIDLNTGLISPARWQPSPNYDARPCNTDINLLVIHGISLPPGVFGTQDIPDFFCNNLNISLHPYFQEIADLRVSAHLFICRQGILWQFVSFDDRAWHAGRSVFQGREDCNDYSIGIELEGTDSLAYTPAQYAQLTLVTRCLMKAYPQITLDRIVGHSEIAPGRKTDPGESFDWNSYRSNLI